jgi:hypothetical protein
MITVKRKAKFAKAKQRRKKDEAPAGRIPRVARLMALAIRFDQLIRDGVVADQAELARLGHVSRARVTQILDLLQLAPDIQEAVLFLQRSERVRDTTSERKLRPIAKMEDWRAQKKAWQKFGVGA